jgi:hypothetical protein
VKGVGKVHIPGCWGAAVNGESFCTCYFKRKDPTEKQKDKKLIKELEKENAKLWRILRKLTIDGTKI